MYPYVICIPIHTYMSLRNNNKHIFFMINKPHKKSSTVLINLILTTSTATTTTTTTTTTHTHLMSIQSRQKPKNTYEIYGGGGRLANIFDFIGLSIPLSDKCPLHLDDK